MQSELRVFIGYSPDDEDQAARFLIHLDPIRRDGIIQVWHERSIQPGNTWREQLDNAMADADVAIFLISANFFSTPLCQDIQVPELLDRHQEEGILIIPVIVGHCDWGSVTWLSRFQVLPRDGNPVRARRPQSKAWTQVCQELRQTLTRHPHRRRFRTSFHTGEPQSGPRALSLQRLLQDLPSGPDHLFGRDADLSWLDAAYDDPTTGVVALIAFGGVGKSVLVRHWLMRRFAKGARTRFLGYSFYSQGTREHAGTSDQFLIQALETLGEPEPNRLSLWMRCQRLAELIAAEPTVLVLDGLEPLQYGPGLHLREGQLKDAGVRELMARLARDPGRSLCVITSRLRFTDESLRTSHFVQRSLDLLSREAAADLLRHRGVHGQTLELENAAEYLGRHPLALVLAAEYLHTFTSGDVKHIHEIPLVNELLKEGRHAKSVMAAYELSLRRDGDPLDLELLHVLGLFDRPARWDWIKAVCAPPAIPGVTRHLTHCSEREMWESISRIRQWGLMSDSVAGQEVVLDAHPLVREYFGTQLHSKNRVGWRKAHEKLFEYLCGTTKEHPDTLEEMEPLLVAVIHGCKAERHQDAMNNVYLPRIMRGREYYAAHNLSALGSLLSVLIHFFDAADWGRPVGSLGGKQKGLTPGNQITALTHAGMFLTASRGYAAAEVERCYARARELCIRAGDRPDLFIVLFGLWRYYLVRGDVPRSKELGVELYSLSQSLGDLNLPSVAERALSSSLYFLGNFTGAIQHAERGVHGNQHEQMLTNALLFLSEPGASCLSYWGMSLWMLGDPDGARRKSHEGVLLSRQLGHAHTMALSFLLDTFIWQFCRDVDKTRERSSELMRLCAEHGFSLWLVASGILHGWALAMSGEGQKGVTQMEQSLTGWAPAGAKLLRVFWLSMLAEGYQLAGCVEQGLRSIEEGLTLAESNDEHWWESELYRQKGVLLLLLRHAPFEAEACFRRALDISRKQGALSLELRASMSFARLLMERGQPGEARSLLMEVYAQVTSGFDTGDVRDAATLLSLLDG